MSETKDDIAAERDALRAENEALTARLAAATAGQVGTAAPAEHRFTLSEGDRQELELRGVVTIGGRQYTTEQVRELVEGVEIADTDPAVRVPTNPVRLAKPGVAGVDYVWPSVEAGRIDPAIAGTPGVNGPAASTEA